MAAIFLEDDENRDLGEHIKNHLPENDDCPEDRQQRTVLSEDQLKDMSKRIKSILPQHGTDQASEIEIKSLGRTFEGVLYTAERSSLTPTHHVAAWNVLCGLVNQCMTSASPDVVALIWRQNIWNRAFGLYLDDSSNARPKSAKQLLATLGSVLFKGRISPEFGNELSKRLISLMRNENGHGKLKPCLQILTSFMSRDILALDTVLYALRDGPVKDASAHADHSMKELLAILFRCIDQPDLGSNVGQAISVALDMYRRCGPNVEILTSPIWSEPFEHAILRSDTNLDELRLHIMPVLFKRSLSDYVLFLHLYGFQQLVTNSRLGGNYSTPDYRFNILLNALVAGKELGLLSETQSSVMSITDTSLLMPLRFADRLLSLDSRNARLAGLSLLITSRFATRPIPLQAFQVLKKRLHVFLADTDANFRGEVVSLMQRLMDRLRAATAVLARQAKAEVSAQVSLRRHEAFITWLLCFLNWELKPTASYQRHISALKILQVVVKSGVDSSVNSSSLSKSALNETKWPFTIEIMTSQLRRGLLDLLMNPFDDVRQTSAVILSIYTTSAGVNNKSNASREAFSELGDIIGTAEATMLASGRADHADGVAHLYSLLSHTSNGTPAASAIGRAVVAKLTAGLDPMLDVADSSLANAANEYPLHGLLTSIRYTISDHEEVLRAGGRAEHLVICLHRVWETVKPVLCNDAPEGFIPDGTEEVQALNTKDTLSYCWRALKESSLLLDVLVKYQQLSKENVLKLSALCFTQLAELRHRGAFSTVAQTWIACCNRCRPLELASTNALQVWYNNVLEILMSRTTINTRRSAGLPSLVCGVLIAENSAEATSTAINDLTMISRNTVHTFRAQQSSLPQVHALNCIKDIMKNTRLAEHSEHFITHTFLLAAESLRSNAWAVRNCGLMLFRAAIDRLLGTSEAHLDRESSIKGRISLSRHPQILEAVFGLLKPSAEVNGHTGHQNEGVFPALQLLQSVQIPDSRQSEAMIAVLDLCSSRSWHIRDKAARTYAAILDERNILLTFQDVLKMVPSTASDHHGRLLCAKYIVARLDSSKQLKHEQDVQIDGPNNGMQQVLDSIHASHCLHFDNNIPLIKAAFLDVLLACLCLFHHSEDVERYRTRIEVCMIQTDAAYELATSMDNAHLELGESAHRRTLAHALAHQLSLGSITRCDPTDIVLRLAAVDPNACCMFFEELRTVLHITRHLQNIAQVALTALSNILSNNFDIGLKCEVQRFLLSLADLQVYTLWDAGSSSRFLRACNSATSPSSRESSQPYADQWLQLEAVKFELYLTAGLALSEDVSQAAPAFIRHVQLAIRSEHLSLFSREAAASALHRLNVFWQYLNISHSKLFLDLCLAVYDLLNDDDEDIRQLATRIVTRVTNVEKPEDSRSPVQEPITSSQRLVKFMIKKWSTNAGFVDEAFYRAFGISSTGVITSFADELKTYSTTDTALFIEEKQNLYVDEAREVRLWSQVTRTLRPNVVPRRFLHRLTEWISHGLDEMINAIEAKEDGPLGWTTKSDVFVLGLRLIYAAEKIVRLVDAGARIAVRPSTLRQKLAKLLEIVSRRRVNPLWLAEMDRVLAFAVTSQLALQGRLLKAVLQNSVQ